MLCFGLLVMMYCEVEKQTLPVDSFCQLYNPIYLSHADSRKTKEQVDASNTVWKTLCKK